MLNPMMLSKFRNSIFLDFIGIKFEAGHSFGRLNASSRFSKTFRLTLVTIRALDNALLLKKIFFINFEHIRIKTEKPDIMDIKKTIKIHQNQ